MSPESRMAAPAASATHDEQRPSRLHLRVARRSLRAAKPLLWFGPLFLGLGMAIYHFTESLSWSDAFLNAAMLIGGMGPVAPIQTEAGKILIGIYAMLAGIVFLVTASVMISPVIQGELMRHHDQHQAAAAKRSS